MPAIINKDHLPKRMASAFNRAVRSGIHDNMQDKWLTSLSAMMKLKRDELDVLSQMPMETEDAEVIYKILALGMKELIREKFDKTVKLKGKTPPPSTGSQPKNILIKLFLIKITKPSVGPKGGALVRCTPVRLVEASLIRVRGKLASPHSHVLVDPRFHCNLIASSFATDSGLDKYSRSVQVTYFDSDCGKRVGCSMKISLPIEVRFKNGKSIKSAVEFYIAPRGSLTHEMVLGKYFAKKNFKVITQKVVRK